GLSLAIALRQALGPSFEVAVADPALARASNDARASAIVAAARRLFETIGIWDTVADAAQPILDMVVTDSRLDDAVRPAFLTFDGEVAPGEPFAHMVENGPRLADGATMTTRLLVAADGARSHIRQRAGIASHGWSYPQASIVTTVAHERDHGGRAEEHFLPAGPFAILPLKRDPAVGHRSSIVWTESTREAERIVALPDAGFHGELERRFGLRLGEIKAVGPRRAFALGLS